MPPPSRALPPSPPARGSFPLDHGGECKEPMRAFLECMRAHAQEHASCRDRSRDYLQCRMSRDLMAQEDLETMGFAESARVVPPRDGAPSTAAAREEDVIAGLGAAKKRGGFFLGLGGSSTGVGRGGGHG